MTDEASHRSRKACDGGGDAERGIGELSPLQARAPFLQNWDWQSVVFLNDRVCERGGAQHGTNSESFEKVGRIWQQNKALDKSLGETLDFLRDCHKQAPFLFFNGNTFAEIARTFSDYLFAELPASRRRQATSAVAHFVAGVLDLESMAGILESLVESASFKVGDKVKTFRGSSRGVVVRILDDGRIVWRADGRKLELIALPESLIRD